MDSEIYERLKSIAANFEDYDLAVQILTDKERQWAFIRRDKYDLVQQAARRRWRWNGDSSLLKISELTRLLEDCEAVRLEIQEQEEELRQLRRQLNKATLVRGRYVDGSGRTIVRRVVSQDTSNPESNSDDEVSERTDYNDSASRAHSDGWFYDD